MHCHELCLYPINIWEEGKIPQILFLVIQCSILPSPPTTTSLINKVKSPLSAKCNFFYLKHDWWLTCCIRLHSPNYDVSKCVTYLTGFVSVTQTQQPSSSTCISQSVWHRMQSFDKQYTFPSTGGDVVLSCLPQPRVSETHLVETPRLPDSDECSRPATPPAGCWSGLNLLFLCYLIGFS